MKKLIRFFGFMLFVMSVLVFAHTGFAQDATIPTDPSGDLSGIFAIGGSLAVAINFVVAALKNYAKLPPAWCPAVAFGLGLLGGVGAFFLHLAPAGMTLVSCIVSGVVLGGSATGLYELKKNTLLSLAGGSK